jgi:hypothetical protein
MKEVVMISLSDDWLSWPPDALELFDDATERLHLPQTPDQENKDECPRFDNNN